MPMWTQHLLVLLLVAACICAVARQAAMTLRLRKGKLGACCARGCPTDAAPAAPAGEGRRVVFLPKEMLSITRRR
jgi:hypothetical protein